MVGESLATLGRPREQSGAGGSESTDAGAQ
jgi:hypothetical protein